MAAVRKYCPARLGVRLRFCGKGGLYGGRLLFFPLFFGFLAASSADSTTSGEKGPTRREIVVERLQRQYEKTQTLIAEFEQENDLRSLGRKTRSKGRLSLSKPGRIRFEYFEPESQLVVSDGLRFWIYTPRLRQAILTNLSRMVLSPAPFLFLAGKGRLTDSFRVELEEEGTPQRPEGVWKGGQPHRLSLAPRKRGRGPRRMWLEVDPETFQIVGFEFFDNMGNGTRIRFWNIKEGIKLSPETFHFEVPSGVDVVRAPERW